MTKLAPLALHVFPTFAVGGAQVRFCSIANHFGPKWRHAIVAMDGVTTCSERLDPSLEVEFLEADQVKGDTVRNVLKMRKLMKDLVPHLALLTTCNWGSIEWAIANTPALCRHVHNEDGFGPEEQGGQLRRRVWTRRLVLRRTHVVVPSHGLEESARKEWLIPAERLHHVPNGIDLTRYPEPAPRPPAYGPDGPVIGTVAALRPEKNILMLIEAFAIVASEKPARLVIVGDGTLRPRLEQHARDLGMEGVIEFAGHQKDPRPYYARFDAFALTSYTEQMPFTVIEAMAAGLPVISTKVGDVAAMVSRENESLIGDCHTSNMAIRIKQVLENPTWSRDVGTANRAQAVRDFDQLRMFETYDRLWTGR